jgi:serine/threonine protein kinase
VFIVKLANLFDLIPTMPTPDKLWVTLSRSRFPWEQEALDFVFERFPAQDTYRGWANFEFIADDGSINEVDLLVACPQGIFLIEIKSNPGTLRGDTLSWTWEHEGRRKTVENPLLLANRKCKRLKSLLGRQRAFKKEAQPFIDPIVFLSHPDVKCFLSGVAANNVRLRDQNASQGEGTERPGIMGAIRRRECPGLRQFQFSPVNRPTIRAVALAMDQAGIRPSQNARRVGDFLLDRLVFDSPTGSYQDWVAKHAVIESTVRLARIYMVARQTTEEQRKIIKKAAFREFQLLERLDHPGILKTEPPTECEYGPVLFFRRDPSAVPLDHFLRDEGDSLTVDQRLDILRQVAEIIRYAHGKKMVHRSLSPHSILLKRDRDSRLVVQIFNWQAGANLPGGTNSGTTQISATLHTSQLIEDSSLVYLAPEAISGGADGGTEMDIFSLGALAYFLLTGRPPADSITELQQKLRSNISNGLNIRDAMDGAVDSLADLVTTSANSRASDRCTVEDFLAGLDLIEEELTRPDEEEKANPLEANKGDRLAGGFLVEKRLGSGSVSVVYLVTLGKDQRVLKVARDIKYNQRLIDEFEILKQLKDLQFREVVKPFDPHCFGDLFGFTMESAGDDTLARWIKRDGRLDLTLLQRFGDDLLRTVQDLDEHGIAHRDIKPENIGVRLPGKKKYQLCLFDFSLSKTSPDEIKVGTLAYLDPFISERKVKRWDVSCELFSAALTLHEMATGVLPVWGDGKSDPASIKDEVTIRPELFDPDLRERFVPFFEKALKRDYRARFDNPAAMLIEWHRLFTAIERPKTEHDEEFAPQIPNNVTIGTQLVLLGLSTRLLNTLDRLNLVKVGDLIGFPLLEIYRLPGVGNKTRRELGELVKQLRERVPEAELDPSKAIEAIEKVSEEVVPDAVANVDLIAKQVSVIGRGTDRVAEQEILQNFLGWQISDDAFPTAWPSQSDLALKLDVTRQRVGQVITQARERWSRYPSITALRDAIYETVCSQGGVMTQTELVASVLAARGSTFEEPRRTQMSSVAVRAALETERHIAKPRFQDHRTDARIIISITPELKDFAVQLGGVADQLASQDPIPSPTSVVAALRAISIPELPENITAPSENRLCQLAVSASNGAALSSRKEVYPAGLEPERALALAQNALFGGILTIEEIKNRIAARYPMAAPLPDRPKLDQLITSLGLSLRWNSEIADGRGAYEMPGGNMISVLTSDSVPSRLQTRATPLRPNEVSPEIAEARTLEAKLRHASKNGAFLALSVDSRWLGQASEELSKRFPVELCDVDALFLSLMKQHAEQGGVNWRVVLKADAAPQDSLDWKNLNVLIDRCVPAIKKTMRSANATKLIINPGLLARYDRMNLLAELSGDVGRSDGIHGIWVLLPASDQNPLPMINQKAIPMINAAQHVRISEAWLANKHRG